MALPGVPCPPRSAELRHPGPRPRLGVTDPRAWLRCMFPEIDTVTDAEVLAALAHDEAEWAPAGEHGVGLVRRAGMRREPPAAAQAMQPAVKQTLDPLNLFNPGKVVGDPEE